MDMTHDEMVARIRTLEAQVAAGVEASLPPVVESYEIPDGWMLVSSDDIPWDDDYTWEFRDTQDCNFAWKCTRQARPVFSTYMVARPCRSA